MDYSKYALDLTSETKVKAFITQELAKFGVAVTPMDLSWKLEAESGTDPDGKRVYRPYVRMAALLSRAKNDIHLNEGEGAKFRSADETIRGWLQEQAYDDRALKLTLKVQPQGVTRRRSSFSRIKPTF